ncbi:MAG: lysophospholipid acyltransferase family protein [Candidatus Omnitrophota bacterium]|jgi:KDO2-lipid IV(A) lauroyltransferase
MILYYAYRLGEFLALSVPVRISYRAACIAADLCYFFFSADRAAVISNLNIVTAGKLSAREERGMARQVFRNFAKYLVDFFRFSIIDKNYIDKFVRIEGLNNIDEALSKGKGVIALSAHIGNWELGGSVISLAGYPLSAVVLTHKHKKVNEFFRRQRLAGMVKPIEIGMTLKECYRVLKNNKILALMGDRDFTGSGFRIKFFGHDALIPKGPAAFSYRIGSAIVPSFMIREDDDTFRLIFEKPIYPDRSIEEAASTRQLTEQYLSVVESYIRARPAQWYAFRKIWE